MNFIREHVAGDARADMALSMQLVDMLKAIHMRYTLAVSYTHLTLPTKRIV